MCEPNTLLLLATGVTAGGQVATGIAANQAGKVNSNIKLRMAADARARGRADEEDQRLRTAQLKGRQVAALGAQGGEINTGSAANLIADTAMIGELEALRIRQNSEREAFAFEAGAAADRATGRAGLASGILGAAGTVLGGASILKGRFNVFKKANPTAGFRDFLTA